MERTALTGKTALTERIVLKVSVHKRRPIQTHGKKTAAIRRDAVNEFLPKIADVVTRELPRRPARSSQAIQVHGIVHFESPVIIRKDIHARR